MLGTTSKGAQPEIAVPLEGRPPSFEALGKRLAAAT